MPQEPYIRMSCGQEKRQRGEGREVWPGVKGQGGYCATEIVSESKDQHLEMEFAGYDQRCCVLVREQDLLGAVPVSGRPDGETSQGKIHACLWRHGPSSPGHPQIKCPLPSGQLEYAIISETEGTRGIR